MDHIDQIRRFTFSRIQRILTAPSDSAARAAMARLRRGIGHTPGELPELWGEFLLELPKELHGHGLEVSREEWAIYTALTLFAYHQQSKSRDSEPMHRQGISLGDAARRLVKDEAEDRERVARRFYPVATASDMTELNYHLRSLVSLLRSESIALDYAKLAADLYLFQLPSAADGVKLRWGEDFCKLYINETEDSERKTDNEETDLP